MRQTTTETLMCFVMEGHHPLGAELLLNIQPRPPLSHIHAIPSGPVQNHRFLEHLKSEEDMFWEEKKNEALTQLSDAWSTEKIETESPGSDL